jgi:hypothetical protein
VREEHWPSPTVGDVGPAWSFLRGIKVFGIAEGIPDWLDLRVQLDELRADGVKDAVPCLQRVGDADRVCFTADGSLVRWDHETGGLEQLDGSFGALLLREIAELEERRKRKASGADRA